MPKYAPAREDGLKPYHVTIQEWRWKTTRIIWAESVADVRFQAKGRRRHVYVDIRRATPEDMPGGSAS